MNEQEKRKVQDDVAFCIEQLEEAQKFVRDGLPKEAMIFAENAKKRLQGVPVWLGLMTKNTTALCRDLVRGIH